MQRISWSGLKRRLKGRYRGLDRIKRALDHTIEELKPSMVILFGSLATGECVQSSDADMVFIFEEDVEFIEMSNSIRSLDPYGLIEPFPYSLEQFKRMLLDVNQMAVDAVAYGVVLYDSAGLADDIDRWMDDVRSSKSIEEGSNGYTVDGPFREACD